MFGQQRHEDGGAPGSYLSTVYQTQTRQPTGLDAGSVSNAVAFNPFNTDYIIFPTTSYTAKPITLILFLWILLFLLHSMVSSAETLRLQKAALQL